MLKFVIFLFLDVFAFSGVLVATLPFLIENLGGDIFLITIAFGSFSFFQFFVSPFWGRLSDRYGRKPLLILNCIAEFIANILLALSHNLFILFAARIVAGLFKTNVSVGTAYISDITTSKNRAKGMGMFGVAFGLGFTLGPLFGGVVAGSNYTTETLNLVAWIASLVNIFNLLFVTFFLKESHSSKQRFIRTAKSKILNQLKIISLPSLFPFFFLIFSIHVCFSGMEGTIAIWTKNTFSWGPREVGYVMLLAGVSQIIVQGFVLRYLVTKYNEYSLIVSGYISLIIGFGLIVTEKIYIIPLAIIFLCYGIGILNPFINFILTKKKKHDRGLILGSAYSSQAIARFVGQPLAGLFFLHLGKNSYFYAYVIFLVLVGTTYLFSKKKLIFNYKR
jgi:multidrug resistance protein